MNWKLIPSILLFLCAAWFLAVVLLQEALPDLAMKPSCTNHIAYKLEHRKSIEFQISRGSTHLLLTTLLSLPRSNIAQDGDELLYTLKLFWIDASGNNVHTETLENHVRIPSGHAGLVSSDPPKTFMRAGMLQHHATDSMGQPLSIEQRFNIENRLKEGGSLRIIANLPTNSVFLRLYAQRSTTEASRVHALVAPTQNQQKHWPEKLGRESWTELSANEILQLAAHRWEALGARGRIDMDFHTENVETCSGGRLNARTSLISLLPGAAAALNVDTQAHAQKLVLFGDAHLNELTIHTLSVNGIEQVRTIPSATGVVVNNLTQKHDGGTTVASSQNIVRAPSASALRYKPNYATNELGDLLGLNTLSVFIESQDVSTVVFENSGNTRVLFAVSTDAPQNFVGKPSFTLLKHSAEPPANTEGMGAAHGWFLVRPEYTRLHGYLSSPTNTPLRFSIGSGPSDDPIRLTVRVVAANRFHTLSGSYMVRWLGDGGTELYREIKTFSLPMSPYEHLEQRWTQEHRVEPDPTAISTLLKRTGRWLSEPTIAFIVPSLKTKTIEVSAVGSGPNIMLSAAARTVLGSPTKHQTPVVQNMRWRYGHTSLSWRRLVAAEHDMLFMRGRFADMKAAVRLESRLSDPISTNTHAHFEPVPPLRSSSVVQALYLRKEDRVRNTPTAYYCAIKPGEVSRFEYSKNAQELSGGLVRALLKVAPDALGAPFEIRIGGAAWKTDIARTKVFRLERLSPAPITRAQFIAPTGMRLWLKTYGRAWPCDEPYRMLKAYRLDPGKTIQFAFETDVFETNDGEASLLIGGFAEKAARLFFKFGNLNAVGRPGGAAENCAQGAMTSNSTQSCVGKSAAALFPIRQKFGIYTKYTPLSAIVELPLNAGFATTVYEDGRENHHILRPKSLGIVRGGPNVLSIFNTSTHTVFIHVWRSTVDRPKRAAATGKRLSRDATALFPEQE